MITENPKDRKNIIVQSRKFAQTVYSRPNTMNYGNIWLIFQYVISIYIIYKYIQNPCIACQLLTMNKERITHMKDKLTIFTKYLLDFMFYTGIVVIITLPLSFRFYGRYNTYFKENYYSLCVIFMLSGVFAILIIQQLRKMFLTVLNDDCFVRENVVRLEKMSVYSFFISVITACRLFIYLTPAVLIIILVFVIAGLFSKVLAGVFDKAVTYKLENDLTI